MYNSIAEPNFGARAKKKIQVSQLAQESFEAFEPFINVFDPGLKLSDGQIIHTITKDDWKLYRRHKAGERPCHPDGTPFNPYLDVIRNIYSPEHVHRHIEEEQVGYFTSGRNGQGLLYPDIDAHEAWQTDQVRARQLLEKLFPFGYYRNSPRGENGYWKLRYSSNAEFNDVANRLETTLQRLFLHCGILCDIEIKGTITHDGVSGRLAKLPFTSRYGPELLHRKEWGWWEYELLDTTEDWCWHRLEHFNEKPIVNVRRVDRIAEHIESFIDEEKVSSFRKVKEAIKQEHDRQAMATVRPSAVSMVAAQHAHRGVKDAPVRHNLMATPVAVKSSANSTMRIPATDRTGDSNGNAFARNQQDLLPFVRNFHKRNRKFPDVDDALIHLRDNGLFSGWWEDNERKRAKRVGDILTFTTQTFDPNLLGSGESQPLSLSVGTFSWWVKQRFGSKITTQVADLRRFDPVTLTAPLRKVSVPAKFIDTFLIVADVCLNQDPLDNKAVPTNRIKKIWAMVKGGSPWNQSYFQIVRKLFNRMKVIRIFDRQHATGKAWRWEVGSNFPAASWKEGQQRLKQRCKALKTGGVDLLALKTNRREREHNTLYQTSGRISGSRLGQEAIRPPP